ncbi:MAG TPA: radical SAM protein [Syntrophales bacterium]|nr:radical SAM protein [Syntrophales bacterium]HPO35703.1 radical SAM protein [Syntrophales bacterium]
MRVAIIAAPYPLEEAPAPPLGISYAAAAFEKAGAEVQIFDYIVSRYTPEKLAKQIDDFRPHVVGTSSVTMNFPVAARILQTVKEYDPRIITVMGGPHVSFDVVNTLKNYPAIDLIVIGEGEATIAELVAARFQKENFPGVAGIAFRDEGDIRFTPPRALIADLSTLPLPARHLLPLSRYQALGFPISIITGRGCPYECIFCQGRRMVGSKMRHRPAQMVVDEIEDILSYGIDRINVADDLFVSHKRKVREVCEEIERRGLKFAWSAFARVNTVDKETLAIMKEAGCDAISFGVESGNQEMLDRIKKKITLDQVRRAVEMCQEVGLIAHCSFIVGLPGESPETLKETKEFAESLGKIDYGYHLLAPFPGTTVREEVDKYDLEILTDDWSLYDANHAIVRTSRLSPEDIRRFVDEFEGEIAEAWEQKVKAYFAGTLKDPWDVLRVEGHFRTRCIFHLLSGDVIEEVGDFPGVAEADASFPLLLERIHQKTGDPPAIVEKVLKDIISRGYVKAFRQSGKVTWKWTHNNRRDE